MDLPAVVTDQQHHHQNKRADTNHNYILHEVQLVAIVALVPLLHAQALGHTAILDEQLVVQASVAPCYDFFLATVVELRPVLNAVGECLAVPGPLEKTPLHP